VSISVAFDDRATVVFAIAIDIDILIIIPIVVRVI
jgi:hypothetical protein